MCRKNGQKSAEKSCQKVAENWRKMARKSARKSTKKWAKKWRKTGFFHAVKNGGKSRKITKFQKRKDYIKNLCFCVILPGMLRKWKVDFEGLNGTSFFCIFVFGIFAFFGVFSRKITCFLAFFGCFWMSKKVLKNGEKLAKMSVEKVLENHAKFGRKMARKSARKMTKNGAKKC